MKKMLLIVAVLTLVAAGWLIYFSSDSSLTAISATKSAMSDITIKIELAGEVNPTKSYSVMSVLSGKVNKIYVSEGDKVAKGQTLLNLESTAIASVLPQANQSQDLAAMANSATQKESETLAALNKAKIALALSQTTGIDYESFNQAFGQNIEDKAEAAQAVLNSLNTQQMPDSYNAAAKTTSGQQNIYQGIEDELTQKSLITGKVMKINVNEGEILAAGSPAMIIADDSQLKIRCLINENDLKKIKSALPVNIITRSDNTLYTGKIERISQAAAKPSGDSASMEALGEVYIKPQEGFKEIMGSSVDVEIILDEVKNVLCLPQECVEAQGYVYVIGNDNVLEKRRIKTGLADGYNIEILEGLKEGEQVVVNPENLKDKQKVKIID